MDIFAEIEKLHLPQKKFVVLGSGILGALGIREIGDVDLLVLPKLFEQLKNAGWKYEVIEIEGRPRDMLSQGSVQVFKDFWWEGGSLAPEEGIAIATDIHGVLFIPLEKLMEIKKAMGREKDVRDVALIEAYLSDKQKS